MQKWLPDEFESGTSVATLEPPRTDNWETLPQDDREPGPRFHKESRFADPATLLANLTQAERTVLYDLVEQDVAARYDEHEAALKMKQAEDLASVRADYEERLQRWTEAFGVGVAAHTEERLRELGQAAARLAIQLAGKITRALVPLDPRILERALQTALYKAPSNQPLAVRMNPEDVEWLRSQEETMRRLGITSVEPDRRIERGGCLVQAGQAEWDATLTGQLESLGEIILEEIATADSGADAALQVPAMPPAGSSGPEPRADDALD